MGIKLISENRKGRFNYEILESFEAGVSLTGTEVKSLRAGKINLNDSFAVIQRGELTWLNANISAYTYGNIHNHDPMRTRTLLVHRHEIQRLIGVTKEKGLTLIPLKAYWKNGRVKLEIGVGRGKKLYDKRQTVREREWAREKGRIMKGE
ncbi:SsrA-binding protein [Candidatus Magnetaquicoccaceae bacterium FCR-1]|uniref:SsrA-binding protein n=1 Tax=Candidatus Magnetaquiglobus chichijimensis TaxID=3141448 RepID=A0ABQ0C4M1_9PROT